MKNNSINWFTLLTLLPILSLAQAPKQNEHVTESLPFQVTATNGSRMTITLRAADTALLLQMAGSGTGAHTVVTNEKAIFLLENDSTVNVYSTAIQGYDENETEKVYRHAYRLEEEDLLVLTRVPVIAVRKYSVLGFEDLYLDKGDTAGLRKLFASFLATLASEKNLRPQAPSIAPAFPGGTESLLQFMNRNLKALPAPGAAQAKAVLRFRVKADGSLDEVRVIQSAGTVYDQELLRIFGRMPRWKPSMKKGKPADAVVTQPFYFFSDAARVTVRL